MDIIILKGVVLMVKGKNKEVAKQNIHQPTKDTDHAEHQDKKEKNKSK